MIEPEKFAQAIDNGDLPPLDPELFRPNPNVVYEDGCVVEFFGLFSKWRANRYRESKGMPQFPYDQMARYQHAIDEYETFNRKYGGCSSVG